MHGGVKDIDVLYNIIVTRVLAQRTNRDTVRTIAEHVLDKHIGAVWLERDTVLHKKSVLEVSRKVFRLTISIVDNRVLNRDIR